MSEYTTNGSILKIENVSLVLEGNLILRDINAEIKDIVRPNTITGQIIGILGPSGLGKTQLFKIIAGLQPPTTGRVLLNSQGVPVKCGQVGVVAQKYPLFEHRTVLGNLIVAGKQANLTTNAAKEKAMELLERFDLANRANFWPAQLSGGQRQRVAIIQQIMCSKHFLLLDEPISGLDPLAVKEVCKLVAEVANMDELNTIILITHDIRSCLALADHLWMIGRQADTTDEKKKKVLPGATIVKIHDLIAAGLAWHPEITKTPEFKDFFDMLDEDFIYLKDPLAEKKA